MRAIHPLTLLVVLVLILTACADGKPENRETARPSQAAAEQTRNAAQATTAEATRNGPQPDPTTEATEEQEPEEPEPFAAYEKFTIEGLRNREYGGDGGIEVLQILEENGVFTRYLVSYPSDDLIITGMLNVPLGEGPFPVVILNHGYYPIEVYRTGDGSTLAADYLASRGFLTFSPDFRSHAGSTDAPNVFRAGHVIDALNSIEPIRALDEAADGKVGMWGHSNGGAITAKAITVSDEIGAAVIYAPASSNIAQDYAFKAQRAAENGEGIDREEWPVGPDEAPDLYRRLSPLPYLEGVEAPVQIHWGTADETVPRPWPADLYEGLRKAGKPAEFFEYPGQPHSFYGADNELYLQRTANLFAENL
jgi:dipeptidyl aminopeptidase/acylaminoacyl peptidase